MTFKKAELYFSQEKPYALPWNALSLTHNELAKHLGITADGMKHHVGRLTALEGVEMSTLALVRDEFLTERIRFA